MEGGQSVVLLVRMGAKQSFKFGGTEALLYQSDYRDAALRKIVKHRRYLPRTCPTTLMHL